jgi:hypothetical protein
MKKTITFFLSLTIVTYCTVVSVQAQGKGSSGNGPLINHGPSINHGHGQSGSQNHGKSTNTENSGSSNKQQSKTTWETKFSERLTTDPAFKQRIMNLLPPNTDPNTAASGFKNHGQFIAALHVSKNLGIPFDQLKAKMTGVTTTTNAAGQTTTTTTESMSLGKAIHELRPTIPVNTANEEANKAQKQAKITEKTT